MKIIELFEEPKDKYFDRLMKTLNIQRLGKGAFGHVFQHPTHKNVVVKILNTVLDPRFTRYVLWCQKHQNNPWVPKIHGVEYVDMPDVQGYDEQQQMFVFTEKLSIATQEDVGNAIKLLTRSVPKEDRTSGITDAIRLKDFRKLKQADWKVIASYATGDEKTIATRLSQIVDKHLDIHLKNVMMRNSQLVFTDPTS